MSQFDDVRKGKREGGVNYESIIFMQNRCRKKVRVKRKKCLKRSVDRKEVLIERKCQKPGSVA